MKHALRIIDKHLFAPFDATITGQEEAAKEIHEHYLKFTEWCIKDVIKNRFGKYILIEEGAAFD